MVVAVASADTVAVGPPADRAVQSWERSLPPKELGCAISNALHGPAVGTRMITVNILFSQALRAHNSQSSLFLSCPGFLIP